MKLNKKWFLSLKTFAIIFVLIFVFSWALYLGVFGILTTSIWTYTTDFLPFIPLPIRLWFFLIILGIMIALVGVFIN